jgi:hypothetical protein
LAALRGQSFEHAAERRLPGVALGGVQRAGSHRVASARREVGVPEREGKAGGFGKTGSVV